MISLRKLMTFAAFFVAATGPLQGGYEGSAAVLSHDSSCWGRFFLDAEALYLRAFEGNLSCVCDSLVETTSFVDDIEISTITGRSHEPHFKWDFGYRIGLGFVFPSGSSIVDAYWTHFDSRTGGESSDSEHHWKIDFDVIDTLYSYQYRYSPCLTFTPFGGIRYANIDQKLHTEAINTINGEDVFGEAHLKQKFSGAGPLIGVEAVRRIWPNFDLYGNIGFSVLYGTFNVQSDSLTAFSTGENIDHFKKHTDAYQPALDASVGLLWEICFSNCQLLLQLGLELHHYFNQNQFYGYGDLYLDGVSAGVGFEF